MTDRKNLKLFRECYELYRDNMKDEPAENTLSAMKNYVNAADDTISTVLDGQRYDIQFASACKLYFMIFEASGMDEEKFLSVTDDLSGQAEKEYNEAARSMKKNHKKSSGRKTPGPLLQEKIYDEKLSLMRKSTAAGAEILRLLSEINFGEGINGDIIAVMSEEETEKILKNLFQVITDSDLSIYGYLGLFKEINGVYDSDFMPDYSEDDFYKREEAFDKFMTAVNEMGGPDSFLSTDSLFSAISHGRVMDVEFESQYVSTNDESEEYEEDEYDDDESHDGFDL